MKTYTITIKGRTFQSTDWRRLCRLAVQAYQEARAA